MSVAQVREALLAGDTDALTPRLLAAAIVELGDCADALETSVFPREPQPGEPATIAAEPLTTDKPALSGTFEEPAVEVVDEPAPTPEPVVNATDQAAQPSAGA